MGRPPDLGIRRTNLALAYDLRFQRTGVLAGADRAVEAGRQAVAVISADHPRWPTCLLNLGSAQQSRFTFLANLGIKYLSCGIHIAFTGRSGCGGRGHPGGRSKPHPPTTLTR
ncbi:hypothetical protein [Amycolatopsis sp. 195334CR]|uniref:hypothetical protein n=1 Tax=Amycolatopsis sp. 195334CR TaxID=2814588 RepID=UPI001A8C6FE0|nr:hypothetical protein [Amycolatopsis sp. 195334CR]MBN6034101.1 hypothetical protein [Amycolatopsis sp. 195334CR]